MRSKVFQKVLDSIDKLPWHKRLLLNLKLEWYAFKCRWRFKQPEQIYALDENDEFIVCPDCGDNSDDGSRCIGCQLGQDR